MQLLWDRELPDEVLSASREVAVALDAEDLDLFEEIFASKLSQASVKHKSRDEPLAFGLEVFDQSVCEAAISAVVAAANFLGDALQSAARDATRESIKAHLRSIFSRSGLSPDIVELCNGPLRSLLIEQLSNSGLSENKAIVVAHKVIERLTKAP